jgi:hypothetical protein
MNRIAMHEAFWWKRHEERDDWEWAKHRLEDNIEMDLRDVGGAIWTEFILLKLGTIGGHL